VDDARARQVARLLKQGLARYGEGETRAAVQYWEQALALDPENRAVRDYLELAYEEISSPAGAEVLGQSLDGSSAPPPPPRPQPPPSRGRRDAPPAAPAPARPVPARATRGAATPASPRDSLPIEIEVEADPDGMELLDLIERSAVGGEALGRAGAPPPAPAAPRDDVKPKGTPAAPAAPRPARGSARPTAGPPAAPSPPPAPLPSDDDPDTEVRMALEHYKQGRFDEAWRRLSAITREQPDRLDVQGYLQLVRKEQAQVWLREIGDQGRAVSVCKPTPELMKLRLAPDEGFLLSQVDGNLTLSDLISISCADRVRTLEILARFLREGIVA
jgi:tetratricopeptide (TPR) repeat protein